MKKLFIFFTLFIVCCTSDTPHNLEGELEERSGRWMKGQEWSWFWYSYQFKIYSGPAYLNHKNGETKEKGDIVLVVPDLVRNLVTPISESFQAVIWHCIVSHPDLQVVPTKW